MLPPNPPQPSCSYLPCQAAPAGIQTSSLMRESAVGVDVTAIRQNAGSPVSGVEELGGVKLPLVMDCAVVTLAFGRASPDRLSHVAALAGGAAKRSTTT